MNGQMDECVSMNGGRDVWKGWCVDGLGEWNDGRREERMNGLLDGWMGSWVGGWKEDLKLCGGEPGDSNLR